MISIHARDVDNLGLYWKGLSTKQRGEIRKATQQYTNRLRHIIAQQSMNPVHQKIAKTTRIGSDAKGIKVRVGGSGRLGSWAMRDVVRQFEFGTDRKETYTEYVSRRGGTGFEVRRRTKKQMPARKRTGWMVYPGIAEAAPELTSWWLGAFMKYLRERYG